MSLKYFAPLCILMIIDSPPHQHLWRLPLLTQENREINSDLPVPWKQQDIGSMTVKGKANFDGKQFTLAGAGENTDSLSDHCHYLYLPVEAETELTVRLVPTPGSQVSRVGLMMRESLLPNSPQVSLLLTPAKPAGHHETAFELVQLARNFKGTALLVKNRSGSLDNAVVTYGQLTSDLWLRMQRKFNSFYAFTSADGKTWTSLGSTFVEMNKKFFAGVAISSGKRNAATTIKIDHVSAANWNSED